MGFGYKEMVKEVGKWLVGVSIPLRAAVKEMYLSAWEFFLFILTCECVKGNSAVCASVVSVSEWSSSWCCGGAATLCTLFDPGLHWGVIEPSAKQISAKYRHGIPSRAKMKQFSCTHLHTDNTRTGSSSFTSESSSYISYSLLFCDYIN